MYSDKVRQLVAELPRRGVVENPTHDARRANPVCGDSLRLTARIEDGVVRRVRFQAEGCAAALASAAALAALCEDQPVDACRKIAVSELVACLGGLPHHKLHGAELAIDTLRAALSECRR